jgi:hypothetical protein
LDKKEKSMPQAAIGAGFGAIPALLSSKDKGVSVAADPYGSVREKLNGWLTGQIGQSGPMYSGQITAPMSDQQKTSLDKVDQYGNSSLANNSTFNNAKTYANKMLTDSYDPATSPYYQAVKAQASANLQDQEKQINSDAAGGGRYWTGARMTQQNRARTQTTDSLNSLLGQMQMQNTQNQIATLPLASSLAQTEQNFPLQQATALQTLGGLPQQLQQNTDNALLNQFYQSQYQYPLSVGSLAAGVQQPPLYQQNTNPLMAGLGSAAGQMLPMLLMSSMGGCWVAAEVFGGWHHPQTVLARVYVNFLAPSWFKNFYMAYGERIAKFIHNKPILKKILRPLFEMFASIARRVI